MNVEKMAITLGLISALMAGLSGLMEARGNEQLISSRDVSLGQGYLGVAGGRRIARDENDGLHLVFTTPSPWVPLSEAGQIVYARTTDHDSSWSRDTLSQGYAARNPSIAVHGDTLHVVYTNWVSSRTPANISYRRSTDGGLTWGDARDISRLSGFDGDCDHAGTDVDFRGNPHVAFIYPDTLAIYWTVSTDGGNIWSTVKPAIFPPPGSGVAFADIIVDEEVTPHIIFTADGDSLGKNVYHSFSIEDQWSNPVENVTGHPLDSASSWSTASLIFDQGKRGHLFVADRNSTVDSCGIFAYSRIDWSTNIGVDPEAVWKKPLPAAACADYRGELGWPSATLSHDQEGFFLVLSDGVEIIVRYSEDGEQWGDFRIFSPDSGQWYTRPNLAYPGRGGTVDVVWEARTGEECEVRFASWDWPSSVDPPDPSTLLPGGYELHQNYPNPFNAVTNIPYTTPIATITTLNVYSIAGHLVRRLADELEKRGYHRAVWDGKNDHGRDVASGIYLCRLEAGPINHTRKLVLLR